MAAGNYNKMCLDCVHLGELCSGTTAQFWTGCVWKNSDYETMKSYGDKVQADIDRQTKGGKDDTTL